MMMNKKNKKTILVVGGAGYIGSHMVDLLLERGYLVVVIDNLSTGHADAIPPECLKVGDIGDASFLEKIFSNDSIDAVMHFASFIEVNGSVKNPMIYYKNNVTNTLSLLEAMLKFNVKQFIFSSSASVYGEPRSVPIQEMHPKNPTNPYGKTKLMVEEILDDFDRAYGFRFVSLRYFNAAGAHPKGHLCERHIPETHLIPLILQVAKGERAFISVYGQDYPTPDGTCIRDYIHVLDVCEAHLFSLNALFSGHPSAAYNVGTSVGHSVLEIIKTAERVTGRSILIQDAPRRAGDPAQLVADATFIQKELGWYPIHSDLDKIIDDAWRAY